MRPQSWRFLGIDLKKVELSAFRKYNNVVLAIATTIEDALVVLRFAQETMMRRYANMEELGVNNFLDLPERGQALLVMVDEAGELLSPSGVKSEQGKAEDELKGEANMIIGSIARLGRAAGVHLVIATQRPDAKLIPGETKANLGVRINCGRTNSTASSMILENAEGCKVKANPRGRLYLQIYGQGDHGQGFFAAQDWIDNYLAAKGMNPDGTPLGGKQSRFANVTAAGTLEGSDLDEREGVDNESQIQRMRDEETEDAFDELLRDEDDYELAGDDEVLNELSDDPQVRDDGFEVLKMSTGTDQSKFHRPEDDWDSELEDLINQNYGTAEPKGDE